MTFKAPTHNMLIVKQKERNQTLILYLSFTDSFTSLIEVDEGKIAIQESWVVSAGSKRNDNYLMK
jgi:hypothetical protein